MATDTEPEGDSDNDDNDAGVAVEPVRRARFSAPSFVQLPTQPPPQQQQQQQQPPPMVTDSFRPRIPQRSRSVDARTLAAKARAAMARSAPLFSHEGHTAVAAAMGEAYSSTHNLHCLSDRSPRPLDDDLRSVKRVCVDSARALLDDVGTSATANLFAQSGGVHTATTAAAASTASEFGGSLHVPHIPQQMEQQHRQQQQPLSQQPPPPPLVFPRPLGRSVSVSLPVRPNAAVTFGFSTTLAAPTCTIAVAPAALPGSAVQPLSAFRRTGSVARRLNELTAALDSPPALPGLLGLSTPSPPAGLVLGSSFAPAGMADGMGQRVATTIAFVPSVRVTDGSTGMSVESPCFDSPASASFSGARFLFFRDFFCIKSGAHLSLYFSKTWMSKLS
jgi:hypothetical protein